MATPEVSPGQTAEIVKAILEKLSEAAHAAQTTAEVALPHIVKAYMARQIGYFLVGILMGIAGAMLIRSTKGRDYVTRVPERNETWPTVALFAAIIGLILCVGATITIAVNLGDTLGVMADPTGMFILNLLKK